MTIARASVRGERGLTALEAAIALAVISIVVIIATIYVRRVHLAQLQATADTEPWNVFEFSAVPKKITFDSEEEVIFHLEVFNPTTYDLDLKWRSFACIIPDESLGMMLEWERVGSFEDAADVLDDSRGKPKGRLHKMPSKSRELFRLSAPPFKEVRESHPSRPSTPTGETIGVLQPTRKEFTHVDFAKPPEELPRVTFKTLESVDD